MDRKTPLIAFFVIAFTSAVAAGPKDANVIVGTAWGITLSSDGTGFYNDVLYGVLAAMEEKKPYRPQPYRRAKAEFSYHADNCIYPASLQHLGRGDELHEDRDYIETKPLIFLESHIFSRPGIDALSSFEGIADKRIAYPNGSALPALLEDYGAVFVPTTDETTKARMLLVGRVDFMSGSLPDNIFVFRQLNQPLPAYNPDLALAKLEVGIVCHATPENRRFVAAFNEMLGRMIQYGAYQGLFEDAGVDRRFLPSGN